MLLVLEEGPLRAALVTLLTERGMSFAVASPSDDDLFEKAVGRGTLVYAPSPTLLEATAHPRPSVDRMAAVLRAANAPGCSAVVAVQPAAGTHEDEVEVLRRVGIPYVVVSAPPLVEEVAAELASGEAGSLWLPLGSQTRAAHAADVARAVLEASESEDQGRVVAAPSFVTEVVSLFEDAARGHPRLRIRGVWAPLHRAVRPLARRLRRGEPRALSLAVLLTERSPARGPERTSSSMQSRRRESNPLARGTGPCLIQ